MGGGTNIEMRNLRVTADSSITAVLDFIKRVFPAPEAEAEDWLS